MSTASDDKLLSLDDDDEEDENEGEAGVTNLRDLEKIGDNRSESELSESPIESIELDGDELMMMEEL